MTQREKSIKQGNLEIEEIKNRIQITKEKVQSTQANLKLKEDRLKKRFLDKIALENELRFTKEDLNAACMDAILAKAPERKEILDSQEAMAKNDLRLSILFKTQLENMTSKD